jgi:TPR repeat protein
MAEPRHRNYIDVDRELRATGRPPAVFRKGRYRVILPMSVATLALVVYTLVCFRSFQRSRMVAMQAAAAESRPADATAALRARAAKGDTAAQVVLGNMYCDGKGVAKDSDESDKWYRMAAEGGDVLSQWWMGMRAGTRVVLRDGHYVGQQDWAEAAKWFRMAAEQGHAMSQCLLGDIYADGDGIRQDYAESLKWYRMAADQGDLKAQIGVAEAYEKGLGVPRNCTEAARWYRMAAKQEPSQASAAAQRRLGQMYRDGLGVAKDYVEAYAWLNLAAPEDYTKKAQTDLNELEKRMTPEQVTTAQRKSVDLQRTIRP